MVRLQSIKHLTITTLFILLIATVKPVAAQITPVITGNIEDKPVDGLALAMTVQLAAILRAMDGLKDEYDQFANSLSMGSLQLIEIPKQLKSNMDSMEKWRDSSDPSEPIHNKALVTAVIIPMTEFKKIVKDEQRELLKLEAKNFLSDDLSDKKNLEYTLGDSGYKDIIGDENMCPPPPSSPLDSLANLNPLDQKISYAELQYDACRTVHNAMTYKRKVLAFTLAKKEQLEKAILAVAMVKDKTIGDHTAKKTTLAELKLLQQEVMDQYNAKMQFADVQIKTSEGSRKYAADSIVGSSPVSGKLANANVQAFKLAVQLASQAFMTLYPPAPYH